MSSLKKLVVFGKKEISSDGSEIYHLEAPSRDAVNKHDVGLQNKIIELVLDDKEGTTWMCDATTLHEIYPELHPALSSSAERGEISDEFVLPLQISSESTERGIFGKIVVKMLKVFAKKIMDEGAIAIARRLEDKHLLNGISEKNPLNKKDLENYKELGAGLFSVDKEFKLKPFNNFVKDKRYFIFIHGTNSNTVDAFADLKNNMAWSTIHDSGHPVLAFQHRTLSERPLENALKLAEMLPEGADLHLLTHSRGGIIGDILNKYCVKEGNPLGFTREHIIRLEEEGNRELDIEFIHKLNEIMPAKKITVSRFVRVACPAAGTVLASKRMDHMLNVLFNLMGGVFGDILKELLMYAVDNKNRAEVLPGLEAQSPDSPFMDILNDPSEQSAIDGSALAVISGNANVALSGNGLLALLSKLFFWKRNDLVVNTDSMYLGVKRKNKIQYFFDEGAKVNHFNFFGNPTTVEAIHLALKTETGQSIPGFKAVEQHEVPATDRALIEYGELYPKKEPPSGKKPIAVLLPGIMGSNLSKNEKEIWLHYGQILTGGLTNLNYVKSDGLEAKSVVKTSYNRLYKWLSSDYDVVVYPFDWRKPITECAADFNEKIKELLKIGKPIKIIGHSLGGVLVRDFILAHGDTWQELNSSKDFRLIFLGSPLGGSHRILTVLFGKDDIIRKLSKIDIIHSKKRLLKMFSKFPGILGLLPLTTDQDNDYASLATWKKIREVFGRKNWPLPSAAELNRFKKYRDNILEQRDSIDYSNMVYIAGKDKCTPYGYYLDEVGRDKEVYFLYTAEGDQSVTWELGIPKQLKDKNAVYYTRVSHGALANDSELFPGIGEILATGATSRLHKHKPRIRGEEKIFRTEPEYDFDLSEAGLNRSLMALGAGAEKDTYSSAPLHISVSKGDLRYASYPVIAGHFMHDGILYAERAIDNYLNGKLSDKHGLGIYPGKIGSSAIFKNTHDNDFTGAIIIGLGEPDELTSFQLTKSVEQGTLNYVLSNDSDQDEDFGLSSLIMACGYGGLTLDSSIKAIISGVQQANEKLRGLKDKKYRTIKRLEFVELYASRSLQCMYSLDKIVKNLNQTYNIVLENKSIKSLLGVQKRVPFDNRAAWWNRLTIKYIEGDKEKGDLDKLIFGASTRDAREEEQENFSNIPVINQFIKEASEDNRWSVKTAKTLFELLIPNAFKDQLKRKGNISWIVDSKTASYPWELLQDDTKNAKPLCISSGMIRQLSVSDYRMNIKRVAQQGALVVADPELGDFIGQLPGAREEGLEVENILTSVGYPVNSLIGTGPAEITRELFSEEYSIIHLAGHGVFNPKSPRKSGMVIGDGMFLSVFDIQQLTIIPELVFVNCCHLGLSSMADEKYYRNRYKLAANIGTELIRIGVKAVIAAGWAVNDDAAKAFSNRFYSAMFSGDEFGVAVKSARNHIYDQYPNHNTWGAYQCYGDPFFKLQTRSSGRWIPNYIVPEEAEIDLDNLLNKLEMDSNQDESVMEDLALIEKAVEKNSLILKTAEVVERMARIYQQMGIYEEAAKRYGELLQMEKANFAFKSMEQYCNISAKLYVKRGFLNPDKIKDYYEKTNMVIDSLHVLRQSGNTAERNNLLGSAYKRLSMLTGANEKKKRIEAYKKSYVYYRSAMKVSGNTRDLYSLPNAIELERLLIFYGEKSSTPVTFKDRTNDVFKIHTDRSALQTLREMKKDIENQKSSFRDLKYWDMVNSANVDLCLLFLIKEKEIEALWLSLRENYKEIWNKAGSPAKKIAELEHLQFLIHGLNMVSDQAFGLEYDIYNRDDTEENLDKSLKSLKEALIKVRTRKI